MADYGALGDLLDGVGGNDPLQMSFEEVGEIVGAPLPAEANSISWWRPGSPHATWAERGWLAQPRPSARIVTFKRVGLVSRAEPATRPLARREEIAVPRIPPVDLDWSDYDAWNTAIAEHFFDGRYSQRPVYLDMDEDVLADLGLRLGIEADPSEAIKACVRDTLVFETGYGTFSRHIGRKRQWEATNGDSPPPILALLSFLALVAEEMHEGDGYAANNYMGRLADACGLDVSHSSERTRLFAHFREQTHELWDAHNGWLEASGGHLGLATARVFDWRVHVGLPISQALVKQADRERLPSLFQKLGLHPGQEMAPRDMVRLLDGWLDSSNLSPRLKALWSGNENKARVAEVVCVELANWDGEQSDEENVDTATTPLRLTARVRSLPSKRLRLSLAVQARGIREFGSYRPYDESGPCATALGGPSAELVITQSPDPWIRVEPTTTLSMPDVLGTNLHVVHDSGKKLIRQPRVVVVLIAQADTPDLIESPRVPIAKRSALLVHDSIISDVRAVLTKHARPGFRETEAANLPGLPTSWSLIEDVEITTVPSVSKPELGPLVPIAWTALALDGGLQLPGHGTWHSGMAPHVSMAAADLGTASLRITGSPEQEELFADGADYVDLRPLKLPDGDYRLELVKSPTAKSSLMSARLRLRSASFPRDLAQPDEEIFRAIDGSAWVLTARLQKRDTATGLRGAHLDDRALSLDGPSAQALPSAPTGESNEEWVPEDDWGPDGAATPLTESLSCIGGAHYWLLGSGNHHNIPGECKRCGLTKWFPTRPGKKKTKGLKGAEFDEVHESQSPSLSPVRLVERSEADHDLLLDALSWAGEGTWASFLKLAVQLSDEPWFAREAARNLSALGHIDLVINTHDLNPVRWGIAPPTIASTPDGYGVLCGFRSSMLVSAIEDICSELGGSVESRAQENGPNQVVIRGFDDDLSGLADVISDETGTAVLYSQNPSHSIAGRLPLLSSLIPELSTFSAPLDRSASRYAAGKNKWEPVDMVTASGAYRFQTRPIAYGALVDGGSKLVRADNRWSKWLGALGNGDQLLGYAPDQAELITRLGAQLPGMYERAAVLASGRLPVRSKDGTMRYESISPALAGRLFSSLTGRNT